MKKLSQKMLTGLVLGSLMACGTAFAAEETPEFELDQIIVTASKMNESVLDAARSVSVITSEDLEKLNVTNVDDAFVRIPGIFAPRTTKMGTISYLSVRGAKDQNSTTVLVDGVKINESYNGNIDFNGIDIKRVERIEVMRGPAASLYGSGAMGAVVNIVTKQANKTGGQVSVAYGSNNTQKYNLYYNVKVNDKFNFDFSFAKKRTKSPKGDAVTVTKKPTQPGYIPNVSTSGAINYIKGEKQKRHFDDYTYGFSARYKFDDSKSLTFRFKKTDFDVTLGSPVSYIGEDASKVSAYKGTPSGKGTNTYSLNYTDEKNGWNAVVGYQDEYKNYSISSSYESKNPARKLYVDTYKNFDISARDKAVAGIYYSGDKMEANKLYTTASKNYLANAKSDTIAVYFNNVHSFDQKWDLTTGLRYDRWKSSAKIHDGNNKLKPDESYDSDNFNKVSPSVSLSYKPDDTSHAYISWAKAFEAPTLYRMYSTSVVAIGSTGFNKYNVASPGLKPQTSDNYEIGYKKQFGKSTLASVALFNHIYKDMPYTTATATDPKEDQYSHYYNAGKAEVKGFEIELNHNFSDKYSGFLNYTYQDSRTKESPDSTQVNKRLRATPMHLFRTGILYNTDKWSGALTGEFISKLYNESNTDRVSGVFGSYDPRFLLNLNIGYKVNKNFDVNFAVNNILDRDYIYYYYQPGRTYEIQMNYKF